MRQIFGKLTTELYKHTTPKAVGKNLGYPIANFRELVEQVAKLAHKNKDYLLFYRGQKNDYLNKAGVSTFYPTIYRDDYLTQQELNYRFDLLNSASKLLAQEFKKRKIDGYTELARKKYIQWNDIDVKIISKKSSFYNAFAELIKRILGDDDKINTRLKLENLNDVLESLPKVAFVEDENNNDTSSVKKDTDKIHNTTLDSNSINNNQNQHTNIAPPQSQTNTIQKDNSEKYIEIAA